MQHALQFTGRQEATAITDYSNGDSRVLGAGGANCYGAADASVGDSSGDGENNADGVNDSVGASASSATGGNAWTQAGRNLFPARSRGSQDTSTSHHSALQPSADDGMLADAGFSCDNSSVPISAAADTTESPVRSPPFYRPAAQATSDKRIKLQQRRSRYQVPPPFSARDFEHRSMNPGKGNQASLPEVHSLRGRWTCSV